MIALCMGEGLFSVAGLACLADKARISCSTCPGYSPLDRPRERLWDGVYHLWGIEEALASP
jgi:hypothetical protein